MPAAGELIRRASMALTIYLAVLTGLLLNAPAAAVAPEGAPAAFLLLGLIGTWRYGWYGIHLARSIWYRRVTFRRWRRLLTRIAAAKPELAPAALLPPEVFIVITSFRVPPETAAVSFSAAIDEAIRYGRPATIVAAIVEAADERLVKSVFTRQQPPERVRLLLVRTAGSGKRHALATALRAIARRRPLPEAAVVVQDGDAVLPPGCLAATLPFLRVMPDVMGLTTDEDCLVPSGGRVVGAWHRLRFAQRHLLMCSHGLSRRLLTLTGRMAAFKVEVATDPSFIAAIKDDALDHWRLGRFPLLTGEDKSSAYWVLSRGGRMIYVADVRVATIEHPPAPDLARTSTKLMLRWFGNMLRASGRCIALGPGRLGAFTWWCLVDQRLSMWTPLVGPLVAASVAVQGRPGFLWIYVVWVMGTRLLQSLALLGVRPSVSGLYPLLIYYNQLYGALVKTWILFRLDRQGWTRQNIVLARTLTPWQARLRSTGSAYLHALALLALATAVAYWTGLLTAPPSLPLALPL